MFFLAAMAGNVQEVEEILRNNPTLDVNWSNENEKGSTALNIACDRVHDSIVSILLAHPDIDVNQKDINGWTPFNIACLNGFTSCVRLLLKDSRVMVNEPTYHGSTPLYSASFKGHLDVIKWWIASGREMDLGTPGQRQSDAIGVAKKYGETEVATLLERFKENPVETRDEIRHELGINGQSDHPLFVLGPTRLTPLFLTWVDFPVSAPPKLTREQFLAFLDGKSLDQIVTPAPPNLCGHPARKGLPPCSHRCPESR